MFKNNNKFSLLVLAILVFTLILTGCSGGGTGDGDVVTNKEKTVNSVTEFNNALQNESVAKIILANDITGDVTTGNEGRTNLISEIDLNGKTVDGSLMIKITGTETDTMTIQTGTIKDDLTIDAASVSVENYATVEGNTNIENVAEHSFNNKGTLFTVNIKDGDGCSFENDVDEGTIENKINVEPQNSTKDIVLKGKIKNDNNDNFEVEIKTEKARVKVDRDANVSRVRLSASNAQFSNEGETDEIEVNEDAENTKISNKGKANKIKVKARNAIINNESGSEAKLELGPKAKDILVENRGKIKDIVNNSSHKPKIINEDDGEIEQGKENADEVDKNSYEDMKNMRDTLIDNLENTLPNSNTAEDLNEIFSFNEEDGLENFFNSRKNCTHFEISNIEIISIEIDKTGDSYSVSSAVMSADYYHQKINGAYIDAKIELTITKMSNVFMITNFEIVEILDSSNGDQVNNPDVFTAQEFVSNLNSTGIHMKRTVDRKMDDVNDHMIKEVAPAMEDFGQKMGFTSEIIGLILTEYYNDPGKYSYSYNQDGLQLDEKYSKTGDTWSWDITMDFTKPVQAPEEELEVSNSTVNMELTNIDNVVNIDENGYVQSIDLSAAIFNYTENTTLNSGESYTVTIDNLNLTTDITKEITVTNENDELITVTIPWNGAINLTEASIKDNNTTTEIDPSTSLTFDFTDDAEAENIIFNGGFVNDKIEINDARFKFAFRSIPQDLNEEINPGDFEVKSVEFAGEIKTDIATITTYNSNNTVNSNNNSNNSFYIEFENINKEQLPVNIDFHGEFRQEADLSNVPEFLLSGDLSINPDYSSYSSPEKPFSEENYIAGDINYTGTYQEAGFKTIQLIINTDINKDEYGTADTEIEWTIDSQKIFAGTIEYDENNETLVMEGSSYQDKLLLNVTVELDYEGESAIGYIYDNTVAEPGNDEILAEIYLREGQIQVDFKDGTTKSLLM